jgi:hypothetical protein
MPKPNSSTKREESRAVVVGANTNMALCKELFPGWRIFKVGSALAGLRLDRIVVAYAPSRSETERAREAEWINEVLHTRLSRAGGLEWLFPWS